MDNCYELCDGILNGLLCNFFVSSFIYSFPALSCEFASVDVSDVLGTVSLLLTTLSLSILINPFSLLECIFAINVV